MRPTKIMPDPQRLPEDGGWKPIASFVVDFQTRTLDNQTQEQRIKVHHIEFDTCATWSKAEYAQVCQWMLDQLDAHVTNS